MKVYTSDRINGHGVSDEDAFQRMLDATPRPPGLPAFLADFHEKQKIKVIVGARREIRRKRYLRRVQRRKIPRQAEHGTGGNQLGTGCESSARPGPSPADRKREVGAVQAGHRVEVATDAPYKAADAGSSLTPQFMTAGEPSA